MARYLVVIEKSSTGYGGYMPDIPGVVMVGDTVEEVLEGMQDGLELYYEVAAKSGHNVPPVSATEAGYVEVDETKFAVRATA